MSLEAEAMIDDASFGEARQSRDDVASSIASSAAPQSASDPPQPVPGEDLLLRETTHR